MNVYTTATLLSVLRGLDHFDPFLLNMFYPDVVTFDTAEIDFDAVAEDMTLAPFVSPLVAGKAQKDKGGTLLKFKPAYVKPKHIVDPARVLKRRPGEQIGGVMTAGSRRDAIIADNLTLERKQILRRLEWMAAQGLISGKVTVAGDDYPEVEVDFQRDAGNTIALLGTDQWSDLVNSAPDEDLEAWSDQAEAPITDYIMGSSAFKSFSKHPNIKALLDTRRGSGSEMELGPDNKKWVSFKGWVGSFRIWVYKGYYKDELGAKQLYIPTNGVLGASAAVEGVRAFGAILDGTAGYQAMEMYPKNWVEPGDPGVEQTMTQSAPLIIPKRSNAAIFATVQ